MRMVFKEKLREFIHKKIDIIFSKEQG
jgi:hypothetical protein